MKKQGPVMLQDHPLGPAAASGQLALPPGVSRRSSLQRVTVLDTAAASTNLGDNIIMEAVSGELAKRFIDAFGPVLYNFYGSTETGLNTLATPAELLASPGTIGHIGKDGYVARTLLFNPYYGSHAYYQFAPKHPQPGRDSNR